MTPHRTTGVAPSELMFGRLIRDKIPAITDLSENRINSAARDLDCINKHKGKKKADKERRAKESDIKIGDQVLLKNVIFLHKLTPTFDPTVYVVVDREKNEVKLWRNDRIVRRNVSHVKKVSEPVATKTVENQSSGKIQVALQETNQDEPKKRITLKLQNKEGVWRSVPGSPGQSGGTVVDNSDASAHAVDQMVDGGTDRQRRLDRI